MSSSSYKSACKIIRLTKFSNVEKASSVREDGPPQIRSAGTDKKQSSGGASKYCSNATPLRKMPTSSDHDGKVKIKLISKNSSGLP